MFHGKATTESNRIATPTSFILTSKGILDTFKLFNHWVCFTPKENYPSNVVFLN